MRFLRYRKQLTMAVLVIFVITFILGTASGVGSADKQSGKGKNQGKAGEILSPVWPPAPAPAKVEFVRAISIPNDLRRGGEPWWEKAFNFVFGTGKKDILVRPYGVTTLGQKIYVADPGEASVWVIDLTGGKMTRFLESGRHNLRMPIGVAVSSDGRVFVSDSAAGSVAVFAQPNPKKPAQKAGEITQGLKRPTGLALDREKNRLYVADTLTHSIQVFDANTLKPLFVIGKRGGGNGQFNFPAHLAFGKGRLYVTDEMNCRIQIFDADGKFISAFGKTGDGAGDFARPKGVALDSEGHIYVVDALFENFQIFDDQGRLLLFVGGPGQKPGEFWLPSEIWIDEQNLIYVTDSYNHRLQIFRYLGDR